MPAQLNDVGVVVIGRNEGERLSLCLASIDDVSALVYVDSGSTDGSAALAAAAGVDVVNLEPTTPFTAARARNAGFEWLSVRHPDTRYVMFVDGDCVIARGWLDTARGALEGHKQWAVVFGRLREERPESSLYNRLCEMEWKTAAGAAVASGGNAMMRCESLRQVDGFDAAVPAGEEPELCVRLRQRGWSVVCLDAEMAVHDAAMTRFRQWWKRTMRSGAAFAQAAWMHGRSSDRHCVRESLSIWFWGCLLPLGALAAAPWTNGLSLWALSAYVLLYVRVLLFRRLQMSDRWRHAALYAAFCVLGKFPQLLGQIRFWLTAARRRNDPSAKCEP